MTCDKAYNLVPLNLLTIDGGEIDLQDLINTENTANLTANRVKASADQIKVYNGAGYTDFWLHDGKGSGMSAFKGKWVYLEGTTTKAVTESIPLTSGFFFIKKAAGEIQFRPPMPYSL